MKFIFYDYKRKKNETPHTLSGFQNKNAQELSIFCLNSNCADFACLKFSFKNTKFFLCEMMKDHNTEAQI